MRFRIAILFLFALSSSVFAQSPIPGKADNKVGRQHIQRGGDQAEGQDQQPVAPTPVEKVEDPEYQAPCDKTTDEGRSDLCAQWTAAKGARQVALLTWPQLLFTLIGTIGLLVSLYQGRKGLKAAVSGIRLAKEGIGSARKANDIAAEGLRAAAEANLRATEANAIALDNLRLLMTDFDERMRPRCVVLAVTLIDKWHEVVEAGSPLPMVITVKNLGGATGRHLLVQIEEISFHDHRGRVIASHRELLRLAPLRAGQERLERMLLSTTPRGIEVHGVTVRGRIGSIGDRIDGDSPELTMQEAFVWRENPLHRGSADLVERAPGDDRQRREHEPQGLPSSGPALGGDA